MASQIENIAKEWLSDPDWAKVYKLNVDVVEDYMNTLLISVVAVLLTLKFAMSFGAGDITCVLTGFQYKNSSGNSFDDFPGGITAGLQAYAANSEECIDASMTTFLQHVPFILLAEAMFVIMLEKMLLKVPKVAGKMEQFYKIIVEKSLTGEEETKDDNDPEIIARNRTKNSLVRSLRRSVWIRISYILKNILEIIFLIGFIGLNCFFIFQSLDNMTPSKCHFRMQEVSELNIEESGYAHMQCEVKKVGFFLSLTSLGVLAQMTILLCSIGSLIWYAFFRNISKILDQLKDSSDQLKESYDFSTEITSYDTDKDFWFLLDLIAHSNGLRTAMHILSRMDEGFKRLCKPKVEDKDIIVTDNSITICWDPAPMEKIFTEYSKLKVDSYDLMIHPAEKKTKTFKKQRGRENETDNGNEKKMKYDYKFDKLKGGTTEYVVSVSCVIGMYRLNGTKFAKCLKPLPPTISTGSFVNKVSEEGVEIMWEPPKKDFYTYSLTIQQHDGEAFEITLDKALKNYLIQGLAPGEAYNICLKTQTGTGPKTQQSEDGLTQMIVTKPLPLDGIVKEPGQDKNKIAVLLNAPDNHSKLKGFELELFKVDGENKKLDRSMTVRLEKDEDENPKDITNMVVDKLEPTVEYEVSVKALCAIKLDVTQVKRKSINPWYGLSRKGMESQKSFSEWQKYITSLSTETTLRFKL